MNEEIKEIIEDMQRSIALNEMTGITSIKTKQEVKLLDYITDLQQKYENALKINQNESKYRTELEMNNAILKEDLDKANDIIVKDRQFNEGRLLELANLRQELNNQIEISNSRCIKINNLQQENDLLKADIEASKEILAEKESELEQLKKNEIVSSNLAKEYFTRIHACLKGIERIEKIIKQQPTEDDSWILSRLAGLKFVLNGSDEE